MTSIAIAKKQEYGLSGAKRDEKCLPQRQRHDKLKRQRGDDAQEAQTQLSSFAPASLYV